MSAEHRIPQRNIGLAIIVGAATMGFGTAIVSSDFHSWLNWVGGLAVVLAGVLLEEKLLLRRR